MQRTTFNRSALIRLLSETHPQIADPKYDFGERLGRWLDLSDAMTLFSVLGSEAGKRTSVLSSALSSKADLPDQLQRVRRTLRDAIANDGVFEADPSGTAPRIPFPLPQSRASAANVNIPPDFTPYHRYYLAHQREMTNAVTALRAQARKALAALSPAGRQLAGLDAAFEKALAARESTLLANVPILFSKCFEQRYTEHVSALVGADDPATWAQPGSWIEAFCNDAKRLLLAELDLRLKLVSELIAALAGEPGGAG